MGLSPNVLLERNFQISVKMTFGNSPLYIIPFQLLGDDCIIKMNTTSMITLKGHKIGRLINYDIFHTHGMGRWHTNSQLGT